MAERTNHKTSKAPSSDGKLRDSELIAWLVGFLFVMLIVAGIVAKLFDAGIFGEAREVAVGETVLADGEIDVWEMPAGDVLLGTQEDGARGVVIAGPTVAGGSTWWDVDFEVSPDGWVRESDIYVDPDSFGIGSVVEMARTANIWDQVGGGNSTGLQFIGALGRIIDGPALFNNEPWWNVDFDDGADGWVRQADLRAAPAFLIRLWNRLLDYILIPSIILSVLLIIAIGVLVFRIRRVVVALAEKYRSPKVSAFVRSAEERSQTNSRWERVENLVGSAEPSDWRLAILEADILLNEIVGRMGYAGETLGERLQQIEKSDFVTLDKAWEAHKVRNTIAHEGGDFILTQREAQRIIGLYREVFQEFHYI